MTPKRDLERQETGSDASLLPLLLERSDDLILVVDTALTLSYLNPAAERASGRAAARLAGQTVVQAGLFAAAAGRLHERLAAALAAADTPRFELDWQHEDGSERRYEVDVMRSHGTPPRLLVRAREVTAQRRIEHDLRLREEAFRTLAENVPDNIIRYGLDGRAVYCNHEIEQRVKVQASRIVGRTPAEGAPPGMRGVEAYEAQLQRTLATGQSGTVELQVPHPDGQARVHSVVIAAERDAQGAVCGAVAVGRDVTDEVRVREALAAREREFRTLAENSPDVIVRYDRAMRVVYGNPALGERTGVPAAQMLGRLALETLPRGRSGREDYLRQLQATLESGCGGSVELQSDGDADGPRSYSVEFIAERDEHGSICGALAIGRDVTQQVRSARALAEKEREFRSLAENAGDVIMRWDTECRMRYVNPAVAGFLDKPVDQLIGRLPVGRAGDGPYRPMYEAVLRVVRNGRPAMLDLRLPAPGGAGTLVHQIRLVPERDEAGRVCSVLGIGRDVSEKVAHLELIESLVRTDPLTRLANRQALHERAPALFAAARRHGRQVAVMLLDLDQFKSINDGLGHSAGDTLLCETARRLGACLRSNDLLVRQGGDEFVVVAPDIEDAEVLGAITDKLHRALSAPLQLHGRELHISASIGVALFPADGDGLEPLLAHADSAMYHAKRGGRGRTEFFRRELGDAVQRRLLLEAALREASHGAGLELHFQPQVCLQHQDRLIGAEALLRWRHPSLGMLAPDAFIGLAEEGGMIVPIGRWVLHTAAHAAARWNRGRRTPLRIAVNVSTRQFVQGDLCGELRDILAETGCDPRWLSVEITESALLENSSRVQQVLDGMRALGVHVALDDFGTGYSALHYLARFPVDGLKIDKSFVQGIGRSERENEVVKAFIAMSAALKMDLVAEGIETAAQAAFLLAEGCLHGQGWRFGRPMPADRFEQLLQVRAAA